MVWGQKGLWNFAATTDAFGPVCSGLDCSDGNVDHPGPNSGTPANTPFVAASHNFATGAGGSNPGFWNYSNNPGNQAQGNCYSGPGDQGGAMGSFCVHRSAAMANSITYLGADPLAVSAWALATLNFYEAQYVGGQSGTGTNQSNPINNFQARNQFDFVPILPDGSQLPISNHQWSIGGATLVASASPSFLGVFAETGQTFNLSSTNSAHLDVMIATAVGGSRPGNCFTPGCGGGGGATGTMTASTNGADAQMFGGCGATTFVGGAGNDVVGIGTSCYGPLAAATVQFGTNTTSKTKQIGFATDYAGNIGAFRPGIDTLKIKSNLDGSGVTTAAQFAALCTVSGGDTICSLPSGNTITLKGVTSSITSSVVIF
jgi:hypothetical protein